MKNVLLDSRGLSPHRTPHAPFSDALPSITLYLRSFFTFIPVKVDSMSGPGNGRMNKIIPFLAFSILIFASGCKKQESAGVPKKKAAVTSEVAGGAPVPDTSRSLVPKEIAEHIPDAYSILDTTRGDLNLDSLPDMLLLLHKTKLTAEDSANESLVRPLVILCGNPDGSFSNVGENDYVTLCQDCGGVMGDPYSGLVIKKGYFSVQHFGGSREKWSTVTTFKYDRGAQDWFLHKNGGHQINQRDEEMVVENEWVKTTKDFGKIRFDDFNPDDSLVNQ